MKLAELAKVEGRAANECVGCYAERRLTGQDHIDLIAAYGNSAATSAEISASCSPPRPHARRNLSQQPCRVA